MAVFIEFNPNESIQNTPHHYLTTASTTKPTDVPIGSTCWDSVANIIYKTADGTNWVVFVTLA